MSVPLPRKGCEFCGHPDALVGKRCGACQSDSESEPDTSTSAVQRRMAYELHCIARELRLLGKAIAGFTERDS